MKRANGEGTIYKSNGRFIGQYTVNGKRKSVYGKTQKEVKEKLLAANAAIQKGEYIANDKRTIGQWLTQWLELYAKPRTKQSTYISYQTYVEKHIVPNIGNIKLQQCKTDTLQRFLLERSKNGNLKDSSPLSAKTVKNMKNMLNSAFEQAVINELIRKNPVVGVQTEKQKKAEMRVFSQPEQKKLMNACRRYETPTAFGIILTAYTGVRLGELLGLKWSDVDFEKKTISISRTLSRLNKYDVIGDENKTEIVISSTKTENSDRTIYLFDELVAELKEYKKKQMKIQAFLGEKLFENDFVIMQANKKHYDPKSYQKLFKNVVKKAGISDANFHALRHTFATRCIESGMDVLVVSKFMGHGDVSVTLNKYGHALKEHKQESILKLAVMYQ